MLERLDRKMVFDVTQWSASDACGWPKLLVWGTIDQVKKSLVKKKKILWNWTKCPWRGKCLPIFGELDVKWALRGQPLMFAGEPRKSVKKFQRPFCGESFFEGISQEKKNKLEGPSPGKKIMALHQDTRILVGKKYKEAVTGKNHFRFFLRPWSLIIDP